MAPSPVILQTEVHCLDCARKIRRAVKHLHGVEGVCTGGATARPAGAWPLLAAGNFLKTHAA
jgi:hypothetical protein